MSEEKKITQLRLKSFGGLKGECNFQLVDAEGNVFMCPVEPTAAAELLPLLRTTAAWSSATEYLTWKKGDLLYKVQNHEDQLFFDYVEVLSQEYCWSLSSNSPSHCTLEDLYADGFRKKEKGT